MAIVYSEREEDQRTRHRLLLHNHVTYRLTARLGDTLLSTVCMIKDY